MTAAVEARGPSSAALLTIFKLLKTLEAHMEHPAFTGLGSGKRAVLRASCPQQGGVARGRKASPKKRPSSLMQTHPSTDRVRGTFAGWGRRPNGVLYSEVIEGCPQKQEAQCKLR